ncbi:hypothetical protein AVEN_96873-1 [Araneus ventricosus]|uniref:Uncharacterized protein n=1 Tax=Araneus ventricosus TaxID=182803 RepID=A0A4Y2MXM3_ARAVE|nr:hypothetical protein AVEN_96873-1 [Araneus ventricosus]
MNKPLIQDGFSVGSGLALYQIPDSTKRPLCCRELNLGNSRPENQPDSTAWKAVRLTATTPMLQKMNYRFDLCSHDGCVCGDKGDPNHYATDYPLTKPFHFMKPGAENLSTSCENIVQNKRSLATTHEYYEDPT